MPETTSDEREDGAGVSLPEVASRLCNVPLLMERSRMEPLIATMRTADGFDPKAFFFLFDSEPSSLEIRDGIAVVPIQGALFGFRLSRLKEKLKQAIGRGDVKGILLDVASPGGQVAETFDLADEIFEARSIKPIWAIANDDAFSAAYALASSAERILVTRTGGVGSVGVIAVHAEFSKMDERVGLTITEIFSGAHKADLSDSKPLTSDARASVQAEVDRLREIFVAAVARNRDMAPKAVRDTEAAVYFGGANGADVGFADGESTFDQVFAEFKEMVSKRPALTISGLTPVRGDGRMTDQKQPEGGPQVPAPAGEQQATVISIEDARKEGRAAAEASAKERASAIRMACDLAGYPERFGEFLDTELTAEQVGKTLLEDRAGESEPEVHGHHRARDDEPEAEINTQGIYARWNDSQSFRTGVVKGG